MIFRDAVTFVTRKWRRTLAAFIPFAAMLGVLAGALASGAAQRPSSSGKDGASFFVLLALSALVPAVMVRAGFGRKRTVADVQASPEGLRAGESLVLARADMAEGYVVRVAPGRVSVRIVAQHGGRSQRLELPTRERALELLQALHLDVLHRTLEVRGMCHCDRRNIPARIVVGADGVLVTHAGFFAYADIAEIARDGSVTVIKRHDGADVRLFATRHGDALTERLREGLEAFRRGEHGVDASALVARRGRSVAEWMTALAGLLGDRDYRSPSVTPEILWRIAEDPAAPVSTRAGAAVALRPTLDGAGRERIRASALASAAPKLRVVLEASAESDDDELARALEACEAARVER